MSFDWKALVKSIAPWLGTALGGPLGGLAGGVVAKALGSDQADDATLSVALANPSPEQVEAIRKAELDFQALMAQMGYQNLQALEAIAAQDRDSARRRQVDLKDWTPAVIAYVVILGWVAVQWYILRRAIPHESEALVNRTLGTLDMAVGAVLGFYYGAMHRPSEAK